MGTGMTHDYRIKPVLLCGGVCDGVYESNKGCAWLGRVVPLMTAINCREHVTYCVEPVIDTQGNFVPAPSCWRELVIEQL